MRSPSVLSAVALCLVSACSDSIPVEPTTAALSAFSARASATSEDEVAIVDPSIQSISLGLDRPAGDYMVASVALLHDIGAVSQQTSSLIVANDRTKLTQAQWVPNDPRRGGNRGLTWGYVGLEIGVEIFDPSVAGFIRAPKPGELESRVVEGMAAWQDLQCSDSPITRLLPNQPGIPDIFQVGWLPGSFFDQFPNGSAILGVTLTSVFINSATDPTPTDIDGNGRPDIAFQDIIYNSGKKTARKFWSDNGPLGTTDLFSVIAHESGHAFGLNHFGKVFVNKNNVIMTPNGPSVNVDDIKYAPKALMNAVYITGRGEITGTDNSAFCQIWANQ